MKTLSIYNLNDVSNPVVKYTPDKDSYSNSNNFKFTVTVFSPDDKVVVAGTSIGIVLLFSNKLQLIKIFDEEIDLINFKITDVYFLNNNDVCISSENNLLVIYNIKSFELVSKLWVQYPVRYISCVKSSDKDNTNHNSSKSEKNNENKFHLAKDIILTLDNNNDINCISLKPFKIINTLFSIDYINNISNRQTSKISDSYKYNTDSIDNSNNISCFKTSPFFNNLMAIGLSYGSIYLLNIEFNSFDNTYSGITKHEFKSTHNKKPVCALSFSPINKMLLVSIGSDCKINFYDVLKKTQIKTFETKQMFTCLSFYSDGKTIACGSKKGMVCIYDLSIGNEPRLAINTYSEFNIESVAFNNCIHTIVTPFVSPILSHKENKSNYIENINNSVSSLKDKNIFIGKEASLQYKKNKNVNIPVLSNSLHQVNEEQINNSKTSISEHSPSNSNNNNNNNNNNNISVNKYSNKKNKSYIKSNLNIKETVKFKNNKNLNLNINDIQKIVNDIIKEELNNVKTLIHTEIKSLHLEVLKQFQIQENFIKDTFCTLNENIKHVIEENKQLKNENKKLKDNYF